MTERRIYQVTELTRVIKSVLESSVGNVWIEGELSNVRRPASGHYYFTVKDETAQIAAVLFRGSQRNINFELKDGLLVRMFGQISVYERSGSYQIIVRQIEEAGQGALQARFEALKKKLHDEGLFDSDRKKEMPLLPRHIGVVTSATGAAIRDILNVVSRRFPNLHIVVAPVKVQGEGAAVEIAAAVDLLNRRGGLDVIIVGRGGGSLEDLWSFNEEIVARAIAASKIPVISAVGHEIDFTISDFVADLRAPTPSAAAELVVGRKEDFESMLDDTCERMKRSLREYLLHARSRLTAAAGSYVFREPANAVRHYRQSLDAYRMKIEHDMKDLIMSSQQSVDDAGMKMMHAVRMLTRECRYVIDKHDSQLKSLNPLSVLKRGYSVTTDADGKVLHFVENVAPGDLIRTRLSDGSIESEVKNTGV